ncbi:MAG: thioredoxin family protein [Sulfurimonas sp.]|jgi:thioredoxin-related protein|nr:thioredoxin family protein [Sulfurimonadaceae bacterium]
MLKIFIMSLVLSMGLLASDLPWLHSYDEALRVAKKEHKDIYVFIGADVCRWCDRYKEQTLSKKEVIDRLNEEFVLVYLSRDRHKVPEYFETQGVPRHYFLRSDGTLIHSDRGGKEVDGLFSMLDEVDVKR